MDTEIVEFTGFDEEEIKQLEKLFSIVKQVDPIKFNSIWDQMRSKYTKI